VLVLRSNGDLINGAGYHWGNGIHACRKCDLEKAFFGVGGLDAD
jgi:hypothetical protein